MSECSGMRRAKKREKYQDVMWKRLISEWKLYGNCSEGRWNQRNAEEANLPRMLRSHGWVTKDSWPRMQVERKNNMRNEMKKKTDWKIALPNENGGKKGTNWTPNQEKDSKRLAWFRVAKKVRRCLQSSSKRSQFEWREWRFFVPLKFERLHTHTHTNDAKWWNQSAWVAVE